MDRIRNWHREEFAAGKLENIPPNVIEQLKAQQKPAPEPEAKKEQKKVKLNES